MAEFGLPQEDCSSKLVQEIVNFAMVDYMEFRTLPTDLKEYTVETPYKQIDLSSQGDHSSTWKLMIFSLPEYEVQLDLWKEMEAG